MIIEHDKQTKNSVKHQAHAERDAPHHQKRALTQHSTRSNIQKS